MQYPGFLNFFGSVFLTTSMLGLYIRHFSSLAKILTHVLKIVDTVLREIVQGLHWWIPNGVSLVLKETRPFEKEPGLVQIFLVIS